MEGFSTGNSYWRSQKIFPDFDGWLMDRCGMDEKEFRRRLGSEKRMRLAGDDPRFAPDAVVECYKRIYRAETDKIAAADVPLTFGEYLRIYEGHTEESFHAMCVATGTSARDEAKWHSWIEASWEKHEADIVPF